MTATPRPSHQLWSPNRGISFLAPSVLPLPTPSSQNGQLAISTTDLQEPTEHADDHLTDQPEAEEPKETKDGEAVVKVEGKKSTDDPPPAVLDYKIVDDLFYAAKKAPLGAARSFWSYTMYRRKGEDGKEEKVILNHCRSKAEMEEICHQYFKDEKLLGFDLEWVPDSRKTDGLKRNVSLIQLASPSRVAVFHVARFVDCEDMVGPTFRQIMEDPTIIKTGVAIKGDTTRLRNYLNIVSQGLVELSNLYKLVTYCRTREYQKINRKLVPLAKQVEEFLHLPLWKGQAVRGSDWSRPLSQDQLVYSASDAYAGVHLYATLEHHRKQLDPCPPSPHFAELNLAIPLAEGMKLADPDEAAETTEVEPVDECSLTSTEGAKELLANTLEALSIEDAGGVPITPVSILTKTKTSLGRKKKPKTAALKAESIERPKDSRVEVAEDRATTYRASRPGTSASMPQLRAYYLWHCYALSPASIAQLLRDPPLKTATIVQYILSAVQSENLPVDHDELRRLADLMAQHTLWARWPVIARKLSATGR